MCDVKSSPSANDVRSGTNTWLCRRQRPTCSHACTLISCTIGGSYCWIWGGPASYQCENVWHRAVIATAVPASKCITFSCYFLIVLLYTQWEICITFIWMSLILSTYLLIILALPSQRYKRRKLCWLHIVGSSLFVGLYHWTTELQLPHGDVCV